MAVVRNGMWRLRHDGILAAIFVVSRISYRIVGVRFDTHPLYFGWQYPDPSLLRDDWFRTIYHFHADPPLFLAYIGLALKLPQEAFGPVVQLTFILAGLILALGLARLMVALGVPQVWSLAITVVFIASPAVVLYENWLYPDYLVAAALPLAALWFRNSTLHGGSRYAFGAFALLSAVVLTRSLFHLLWLIACIALVALLVPAATRRRVLVAAAVPLAVVLMLYSKNLITFGTFSSTSCLGLSADRVVTAGVPSADLQREVTAGRVSTLALENPFDLPTTDPRLFTQTPATGIPVLDQTVKPTSSPPGLANLGHRAYVGICATYLSDAEKLLAVSPRSYFRAERAGWLIFFQPSDNFAYFSAANRAHVSTVSRVFDVAYGEPVKASTPPGVSHFSWPLLPQRLAEEGWFIVATFVIAITYGARQLKLRRDPRTTVAVGFATATLLYVMVVGNLLEAGENNRFQFVVDPLALALAAAAIATSAREGIVHRVLRRRDRSTEA